MPDWYLHPALWLAPFMVIAGFWTLIKGADIMVNGAVSIAQRFQMTPAVIGATVVAFGTSLPELMVSLFSALAAAREGNLESADGPAAIAVANVVGSNIFNLGAVLGFSALVKRLPVPPSSRSIDFPLMMISGVLLILFSWPLAGGPAVIGHIEGFLLILGLIGFVALSINNGRKNKEENTAVATMGPGKAIGLIAIGIGMLAIGGDITLTGALQLARSIGMSERVIGLTVMAIGTSLPELVTSIQAARRGQCAMAVGNVVGSNCFNVLCIVGISATIVDLPVNAGTLYWDYWWMIGMPLILVPSLYFGKTIGRASGITLIAALICYVTIILIVDQQSAAPAASSPIEEQGRQVGGGADDVVGPMETGVLP